MQIEREWGIGKYTITVYADHSQGDDLYSVEISETGTGKYFLNGDTSDGKPNQYESYSGFMYAILDFLDLEASL